MGCAEGFIQDELTAEDLDIESGLYARVDAARVSPPRQSDYHVADYEDLDSQGERAHDHFGDEGILEFEFTPNDGLWELPCKVIGNPKAKAMIHRTDQDHTDGQGMGGCCCVACSGRD